MSHATSSTCHFNLSFINWARLSLLPRPPPYMSTYLLCVSIDMHSRVCKFLRVKCAKLDKSLYQEYTLTHAMREGEREITQQLNMSIDMHSCVCKFLRVNCQKLGKNLCQE